MKKLEYDHAAYIWIAVLLSTMLAGLVITNFPVVLYVLAVGVCLLFVTVGIPSIFVWFWNRFIARED